MTVDSARAATIAEDRRGILDKARAVRVRARELQLEAQAIRQACTSDGTARRGADDRVPEPEPA
jgi:hypothetical protein